MGGTVVPPNQFKGGGHGGNRRFPPILFLILLYKYECSYCVLDHGNRRDFNGHGRSLDDVSER